MEERLQGKETVGFVSLGLRQRVIDLARRKRTNHNDTSQTVILL
jgi:hypothetical protein